MKNDQKRTTASYYQPEGIFKDKNMHIELAQNGINSLNIENVKITDAGSMLIYCKNPKATQIYLKRSTYLAKTT